MQFRRFGKSPQGTDLSPLSLCRFTKNYESHTAITSMVATLTLANPADCDLLCKSTANQTRFCNIPSLRADSQNLRGNPNLDSVIRRI